MDDLKEKTISQASVGKNGFVFALSDRIVEPMPTEACVSVSQIDPRFSNTNVESSKHHDSSSYDVQQKPVSPDPQHQFLIEKVKLLEAQIAQLTVN